MKKFFLFFLLSFGCLFADEIENLTKNLQANSTPFWESLEKKKSKKDLKSFLSLAEIYFDLGHYYSARKYYRLYLEKEKNQKAEFRNALCDFYISGSSNKLAFMSRFIKNFPNNYLVKYLILEKGKHFLNQGNYWKACDVLDQKNLDFPYFNYFRALSFQKLGKFSSSAYLLGLVLKNTKTPQSLAEKAVKRYIATISNLPWQRVTSRTSKVIMFMPSGKNKIELLLFLAKIYDQNYLYAQSNDIYYDLISSEKMINLYKFTITNNVELKNFEKALQDIKVYLKKVKSPAIKKEILEIKSQIEAIEISE